jgi:hypothetical protein
MGQGAVATADLGTCNAAVVLLTMHPAQYRGELV